MEVQHWDLFADMPYLIGYATKEIMRHRQKNGKEDLLKAIHIIEKIIEREYTKKPLPATRRAKQQRAT